MYFVMLVFVLCVENVTYMSFKITRPFANGINRPRVNEENYTLKSVCDLHENGILFEMSAEIFLGNVI